MSNQVKITSLQLENVKRVRALSLMPTEDGLTVIGGRNGQGKTSVLDAIAYALGGETFRPPQVQNSQGISPATIIVKLDNGLVVTRTGKNCALKVTDPTGARSGQKLLDSFIEKLALDLPKFLASRPQEKAQVILKTLGIEERLQELANRENIATEERRTARTKCDLLEKQAQGMQEYPEVTGEVDVLELMSEIEQLNGLNASIQDAKVRLEALEEEKTDLQRRMDEIAQRMKDIDDSKIALYEMASREPADTSSLKEELANATDNNAKHKANMDKRKAYEAYEEAASELRGCDLEVEIIRGERRELLKSVEMPLPGLTVEDGELVYKGQKWDNMSTAEQYMVAISICHCLNPKCGFVLIDRLETFDLEQMILLDTWLRQHNLQAIATRVSTGDECSLIIEDGIAKQEEEEFIGGF